MSDEKEVLWICPKCNGECYDLNDCAACGNLDVTYALTTAVEKRAEIIKRDSSFQSRISTLIVLLILFGVPIFLAIVYMQGGFAGKESTVTTQPEPPPKPTPALTPDVEEAVKKYVEANWNGWSYKGYDDASYAINDDAEMTVFIEQNGHLLRLNLKGQTVINGDGKAWVVTPDTSESNDVSN